MKVEVGAMLGALALSACAAPLLPQDGSATIKNQCTSSSACGDGAVCVEGACYASQGQIDSLLLEVVPDPTDPNTGGLSFLLNADGLSQGGRRDLTLPAVNQVVGTVRVGNNAYAPTGCTYGSASDGSIPARIAFTRTNGILGFSVAPEAINATLSATNDWSFQLSLVPDTYDLYVEPSGDSQCQVAPVLFSGVQVDDNHQVFSIDLASGALASKVLQGIIRAPEGTILDGWTVDLVEPSLGRVISTSARLGATSPTNFSIVYRPVQESAAAASKAPSGATLASDLPFIRATPPKQIIAPTAFWSLAVNLDGDGVVDLNLATGQGPVQHLTGRVLDGNDNGIAATLTFSSMDLNGTAGINASYAVTEQTDDGGAFTVDLLPGAYRAATVPAPLLPWAIATTTFETGPTAPPNPIGSLRVLAKPELDGVVVTSNMGALNNAAVQASPVIPLAQIDVLHRLTGSNATLPRAGNVVTGADGSYRMQLDPGTFDVSVRPSADSGFPWFVRPRTVMPYDSGLLDATVTLPVPVEGIPTDGSTKKPLRNAILRAYASLPDGSGMTQVGEVRTQDDGSYHLLLPTGFAP